MPCHKPKRNTTYHQRYNAISALDVHTIGIVQHLWNLCILQLKLAEQLLALSLMLDLDHDDESNALLIDYPAH
jgi:hypothetical protein